MTVLLHFRAKGGRYVLPAVAAGWPTLPLTLWIECFRMFLIRQWVLSLPVSMRYRLAYDAKLTREVLRIFVQSLFSSLRRRARQRYGIRNTECGAVTFVQRFGGAINLNIHFHTLGLDGVYYEDSGKRICFKKLPPPTDAEVSQVMKRIVKRIKRLLDRRGLGSQSDPEEVDPLLREQPLLAESVWRFSAGKNWIGTRSRGAYYNSRF